MQKHAVIVAGLGLLLAASSCRRSPLTHGTDAGSDADAPSAVDVRPGDAPADGPAVDSPSDMTADTMPDLAGDAGDVPADAIDVRADVIDAGAADATDAVDAGADVIDAGAADAVDAGGAMCPAGVAPLDVCGCGCCGEAMGRACYYPSRGETRESVPNPIPPPTNCSMAGCSIGVRHLCCADPGPRSGGDIICGDDTGLADGSDKRLTITRRIGDVCTMLVLGSVGELPIEGPPGYPKAYAWRAPCDAFNQPTYAIGGLGKVTPGTSGTPLRYDVHAVVFFDSGTGVAEAVRIDKDDVAIAPLCTPGPCPTCTGTCAFDTTYTFTTTGGLAPYRMSTVLAPPASYVRYSRPEGAMGMTLSCTPSLPACGGDSIDVADVMAALTDADVLDAFERSKGAATWPFYGVDYRGGDGSASLILRDSGGGFLVGGQCPDVPTRPCTPIPPGLSRLVSMLEALDQQQIAADPRCAFMRN